MQTKQIIIIFFSKLVLVILTIIDEDNERLPLKIMAATWGSMDVTHNKRLPNHFLSKEICQESSQFYDALNTTYQHKNQT